MAWFRCTNAGARCDPLWLIYLTTTRLAALVDNEDAVDSLRLELDNLLARLLDGPLAEEIRRLLGRTAGNGPLVDRSPVLGAGPAGGRGLAPDPGSPVRLDPDGVVFVPVLYGTSRAWRGGDDPGECYTADRGITLIPCVEVSLQTYCIPAFVVRSFFARQFLVGLGSRGESLGLSGAGGIP